MAWQRILDDRMPISGGWYALPDPVISSTFGAENYLPDTDLLEALNTAIFLGQPLLLTGQAGCGKTEVGNYLSWKVGLGAPIRFDTKSTTTARDLFYTFDALARFNAAQIKEADLSPMRFITFHALGRAILYANEPDAVETLVKRSEHPGKRRSVVLIDEIDKAPRDVPNDLLVELERMQFYVAELNRTVSADPKLRPIVVITSNSEKTLPDPFLRRCVFHNMRFPTEDRLREIIAARIEGATAPGLLDEVLKVFRFVRRQARRKKPGTAELLGFVLAVRDRGLSSLQLRSEWIPIARVTLLKNAEDQDTVFRDFSWTKIPEKAE